MSLEERLRRHRWWGRRWGWLSSDWSPSPVSL